VPLTFSSSPGQATPGDASPGFVGYTYNPLAPLIRGSNIAMVPAAGTTQNVALPPGGQPGDTILLWCVGVANNTTWSSPGFTAAPAIAGAGGNGSCQLLWKPNVGDLAGTSYVVTASQIDVWGTAAVPVGNQDQSLQFDGAVSSGLIASGVVSQVTSPSVTTSYPADLLVWLGFTLVPSGSPLIGLPAGFSASNAQAYGAVPGTTNVSIIVAYAQAGVPGVVGQQIGSVSTPEITGATLLAFPLPVLNKNYVRPVQKNKLGQAFMSLLRRRRQATTVIQPTGVQFPLVVSRKFRGLPVQKFRIRAYNPIPPQAQQSQPFPTFTRQQRRTTAGAILQLARIPRSRQQPMAPPPQGALAPSWVPQTRPAAIARRLPFLRRPKGAQAILKQAPQPGPVNAFVRRQRIPLHQVMKLPRHRGQFGPMFLQGNQGQGNPAILPVRARRRPWAWYRRHKVFSVPTPKQTQQARAAWVQASVMHVSPLVTNTGRAAWTQGSLMSWSGVVTRYGTLHWSQGSGWRLIASGTRFARGSWVQGSVMHVSAIKIRFGHAAWTQASTWSLAGSRGRGMVWSQASVLALTPVVTHPAGAAWSASSSMLLTASSAPYGQEIIIPPLAIPGVNRPPLEVPVSSPEPVTEAVIKARVEDEIFDEI
jgi:hypothetical protein